MQIGGKWKLPIINVIRNQGILRFGKIHQIVDGISRKVLSEQFKSLESDELVVRKQFEEIPLKMEYALNERSKGLWEVFKAIEKWSIIVDKYKTATLYKYSLKAALMSS
jgi:DNA-binding HxlR family transcriptional regulator